MRTVHDVLEHTGKIKARAKPAEQACDAQSNIVIK